MSFPGLLCRAADAVVSRKLAEILGDWIERFGEHLEICGCTRSSIESYRNTLKLFRDWVARETPARVPEDLDRELVLGYQQHLLTRSCLDHRRRRRRLSVSSREGHVTVLRGFFRFLEDWQGLRGIPADVFERSVHQGLAVALSESEVRRLLGVIHPSSPLGLRDRAIVEILLATGMGQAELLGLHTDDIDGTRERVHVRGEGNRERLLPLGKEATRAVRLYLQHGRPQLARPDVKHLLVSCRGQPLKRHSLRWLLSRYARSAGVKKCLSGRVFQNTCALRLKKRGEDLRSIGAFLGHAEASPPDSEVEGPAQARLSPPGAAARGGRERLWEARLSELGLAPEERRWIREFVWGTLRRRHVNWQDDRYCLLRFLAYLKAQGKGLCELGKDELERFIRHLQDQALDRQGRPYSVAHLRRILLVVRMALRELMSQNRLLRMPAPVELGSGFRLPANPLTTDQVKTVLNLPDPADPLGLRDRAMLEILYGSGLRPGELARLELSDLDLAEGLLRVQRSKNGEGRVVPLGRWAGHYLERYLRESRPVLERTPRREVWLGEGRGCEGRPFSAKALALRMTRVYQAAVALGRPFRLYLLRHSFATHLLEGGADIRYVQALLGHRELESTKAYTYLRPRALQRMHQRFHPRG